MAAQATAQAGRNVVKVVFIALVLDLLGELGPFSEVLS